MAALQFPCTLFKTQKWMGDYGASGMRCGDLTEAQLKMHYHLDDVFTRANSYTLTKITPFTQPKSMFYGSRGAGEKITRQQCAAILFDEMRHLSHLFPIYGPYKHLIRNMITYMQYGNGLPFTSMYLDSALKEHISSDSTPNSTRLRLREAIEKYIDWESKCFPENEKNQLINAILDGKLPKFYRFQENLNGMGITIHDTWATHITIKSLQVDNDHYQAVVH